MIKEIIATGADVNEAIDSGCLMLGVDRTEAQFEIIDLPHKSFFGLKKLPAKVRVYIELPDPPAEKKAEKKQEKKQPEKKTDKKPQKKQPEKQAEPAEAPAAAEAAEAEADGEQSQKSRRRRDRRKKKNGAEAAAQPAEGGEKVEVEPTEEVRAKTEKARAYVAGILEQMGYGDIEIKPFYYAENVRLQLGGERLGSVIGRRGETLDALQYLASLVANKGEGSYLRINIDSGNYREKRERTLEALARKLANNALKSGRSVTLEPMNPYERRIIHGTVSVMRGVVSSSIGVEPNRRVVITPDGSVEPAGAGSERSGSNSGKGRKGRGGRGRSGGGERGGRRDDPPAIGGPVRREAAGPRPEKSAEEKALTESSKLYGKIEL